MGTTDPRKWRSYEEVAQHLLNEFADRFGLGRVEGKQIVPGASGTNWEIDAKGVCARGEGFVIVECRRHIKSKIKQESVAAIAFRIVDTGAAGAILVTPLGLQYGARKVAEHSKIVHVTLNPNSTTTDYIMKFLGQVFVGLQGKVGLKTRVKIKVIKNGKITETREIG